MDKQREGFEKAYEPNPNKSPFTEVKFDEVARVYKPLDQFNPRIASSLNAAWYGWRIRQAEVDGLQAKVEELQKKNAWLSDVAERENNRANNLQQDKTSTTILLGKTIQEKNELQKRVDAVKGLAQTLWEKSNEKHEQGKVWESKALGECADEILDVLEQALKGGEE